MCGVQLFACSGRRTTSPPPTDATFGSADLMSVLDAGFLTYRNRQVGGQVERQWAKSLRGPSGSLSARSPFRTGTAPFLPPIDIPSVRSPERPPKYTVFMSPLERMQAAKPFCPTRNFTFGGNERGNPSYYPLPLGKNEFSTRCG